MAQQRWTRAAVQEWCDARDITLTVNHISGTYHVHLDIDCAAPMIFRGYGTHNAAMWDYDDIKKIDWGWIGRRLEELDFGRCEEADCEYCADKR